MRPMNVFGSIVGRVIGRGGGRGGVGKLGKENRYWPVLSVYNREWIYPHFTYL